MLTGRLSFRTARFGRLLVLRVEVRDSNGFCDFRDASVDDLADLGLLNLSLTHFEKQVGPLVPLLKPVRTL